MWLLAFDAACAAFFTVGLVADHLSSGRPHWPAALTIHRKGDR